MAIAAYYAGRSTHKSSFSPSKSDELSLDEIHPEQHVTFRANFLAAAHSSQKRRREIKETILNLPDLLFITEQPNPFARFRYRSEKRECPLEGEKTYPEVMVNPQYLGLLPMNSTISASLVTRSGLPHWHELSGTTFIKINCKQPKAQFKNLSVVMNKLKETEFPRSKEDLRAVRLHFSLRFEYQGQIYYGECMTHPVYNGKLIINKLSSQCGPVTGGQELIILCSKVRKASTALLLTEEAPSGNPSNASYIEVDRGLSWIRDFESGRFNLKIPGSNLSFHHQYVIVFEMPSYHDITIKRQVQVNIQIIDVEDGTESQEVCYFYLPVLSLTT